MLRMSLLLLYSLARSTGASFSAVLGLTASRLKIGEAPVGLDRSQFFNVHSSPGNAVEWRAEDVALFGPGGYNAHLGRSFAVSGRMRTLLATPSGEVNETALAAACEANPTQLGGWAPASVDLVTSAKTEQYFPAMEPKGFVPRDAEAAAQMWSLYLKHCGDAWQDRVICEVMNEPNVKVKEANTTWDQMIDIHVAVADRIHADYANSSKTYLVGGPTQAYPEEEAHAFAHFHDALQPFINRAGSHIDYLSVHLYDSYGVAMDADPGNYSSRTGNNVDALLDLYEAYAAAELGKVLPHSISEYGSGFKVKGFAYMPLHDWFVIRGVVGKLMQLLARPDRILKAIPFIVGKATWYVHAPNSSYPYVLWRTENASHPATADWQPTHLHKFYQVWSNVTGDRLVVTSSDANVQVNAFHDPATGTTFLCLNNLRNQSANITFTSSTQDLLSTGHAWQRSQLFYDVAAQEPVYHWQPSVTGAMPHSVVLSPEENSIFAISLLSIPSTGTPWHENTYYANATVVPIVAGIPVGFSLGPIIGTDSSIAYSVLRIGFSVPSAAALAAEHVFSVKVNDVDCPVDLSTQMAGKIHTCLNTGEVEASFRLDLARSVWAEASSTWTATIQGENAGVVSSVALIVGTHS